MTASLRHVARAALAALGLMLCLLATGCASTDRARSTTPPATPAATQAATRPLIAIIGAYDPEMRALHARFGVGGPGWRTESHLGIRFDIGTYQGRDVIVFRTGMSVVNAAYQLQVAFDGYPISHVLFAGVAGGTDPALNVGDVVIPATWAYHDESAYLNDDGKGGFVLPDYYKPKYRNFGMIFPDDVAVIREGEETFRELPSFPADPALLDAARRALPSLPTQVKGGRNITVSVGGTGITGSVFLDNAAYRDWTYSIWQARCVDMESTALAHVAWANRKPILIIRGLSDLAGGQHGKNPIDENEAPVSAIAAEVLAATLAELR